MQVWLGQQPPGKKPDEDQEKTLEQVHKILLYCRKRWEGRVRMSPPRKWSSSEQAAWEAEWAALESLRVRPVQQTREAKHNASASAYNACQIGCLAFQ